MKKFIFSAVAGVILLSAVFAGYKVHQSKNMSAQDILTKQNIEALSHNEGTGMHNHGPTKNPWFQRPYCANTNNIDCAYQ